MAVCTVRVRTSSMWYPGCSWPKCYKKVAFPPVLHDAAPSSFLLGVFSASRWRNITALMVRLAEKSHSSGCVMPVTACPTGLSTGTWPAFMSWTTQAIVGCVPLTKRPRPSWASRPRSYLISRHLYVPRQDGHGWIIVNAGSLCVWVPGQG